MTKVLDILKEELEIAMILSGIIQCIFYEESNAWGWGLEMGRSLCAAATITVFAPFWSQTGHGF